MISERKLKKWRKDALQDIVNPQVLAVHDGVDADFHSAEVKILSERILQLTQELLDQYLMKK